MTQEGRSQFGLQNREGLIRWMASLSPQERIMAGIEPPPPVSSGSSRPAPMDTATTDPNLTGIQEEPEQEVPADEEVEMATEVEGQETLYFPTERDYRDIRADESWEPTHSPGTSSAAPKAFPKKFSAAEVGLPEEGKGKGKNFKYMGVFITKFGQRYHVFRTCQTLTSSTLRSSPPCHKCAYTSEMSRVRRVEPLWSKGWGEVYYRNAPSPLPCSTGGERKYDICTLCERELRFVKMTE